MLRHRLVVETPVPDLVLLYSFTNFLKNPAISTNLRTFVLLHGLWYSLMPSFSSIPG